MNGQWIGRYTGTNTGLLVVDFDDMETHYEGHAFAYDDNSTLPGSVLFIRTPDKARRFQQTLDVFPIHPHTGDPATWNQIAQLFPENTNFPTRADVTLDWADEALRATWTTDIGTSGTSEMPKTKAGEPTEYQPLPGVTNWQQFKEYVNSLEHRRNIFRGQRDPIRLRTSYHRTGRADLTRFLAQDIQTLHRHLSQRTTHIFNLAIPDQNGAFFNLLQHHGYPTPLLDWTYSPYVAAFFAYRRLRNAEAAAAPTDAKVRIFMFDQKQWRAHYNQLSKLTPVKPHFSLMEFMAIDNERLIPQQSISSVTNIDDIETYIRSTEIESRRYPHIIDLPVNERQHVMRELSLMGITAGALFPGLDGACEELRERFFL